jgi:hypothetical protein
VLRSLKHWAWARTNVPAKMHEVDEDRQSV